MPCAGATARATTLTTGGAGLPIISAERRQGRYDAILDAARTAFAERSYEAVSIAQIARAAGISDGLVYHYFRDKRDLLFHVLRTFYERIMVDLETKVRRETTFEARLEALIRSHLEVFVADTDLCRLFISEVRVASDYRGSRIQELNRAYTSILIDMFDEAVRGGKVSAVVSPRLLRDVIFGAIEHRAWRYVNGSNALDTAATARELTALFTQGLTPRPAH